MSISWDPNKNAYVGKFVIDSNGESQSYKLNYPYNNPNFGPVQGKIDVKIDEEVKFSTTVLDCDASITYDISSQTVLSEGNSMVVNVSTSAQNFVERELHWSLEPIDSAQGDLGFSNYSGSFVLTDSNPSNSFTIQSVFDSGDNVLNDDFQKYKIVIEDRISNSPQYVINSSSSSNVGEFEITVLDNDHVPAFQITPLYSSVDEDGELFIQISSNVTYGTLVNFSVSQNNPSVDNIQNVSGYNNYDIESWDSNTKQGSFTPLSSDGSAYIVIQLQEDNLFFNSNELTFSLDDGTSETVQINEISTIEYSITSDSIQTTEGGNLITVNIEETNVIGSGSGSTLSISSNSPDDVVLSTENLLMDSTGKTFTIEAILDSFLELQEINTITISNSNSNFTVNGAAADSQGLLEVTLIDNTQPVYSITSDKDVSGVDEDGGTVVFTISSNVLDGRDVGFEIIENTDAGTGLSADNIDYISGPHFQVDTTGVSGIISQYPQGTLEFNLTVVLESDNVFWEGNDFKLRLSDGTEHSVNINENSSTPINYEITHQTLFVEGYDSSMQNGYADISVQSLNLVNSDSDIRLDIPAINSSLDLDLQDHSHFLIESGSTSKSFKAFIIDDNLVESDRTVQMTIQSLNNSSQFTVNSQSSAQSGSAILSFDVTEDDSPIHTVTSSSNSVNEDGGTVTYYITSNVRTGSSLIDFTLNEENVSTDHIISVTGSVILDSGTLNSGKIQVDSAGDATLTVQLQGDSQYIYDNRLVLTLSESGSQFTLDGVTYENDSITKYVNIQENAPSLTSITYNKFTVNETTDRNITLTLNGQNFHVGDTTSNFLKVYMNQAEELFDVGLYSSTASKHDFEGFTYPNHVRFTVISSTQAEVTLTVKQDNSPADPNVNHYEGDQYFKPFAYTSKYEVPTQYDNYNFVEGADVITIEDTSTS